ncbi:unnamed protein product [Pocillopora meandrina]|uniref:G-protein coupled receptors family 1 profile domain-containing protein n=1 Tax=Pocillopora meandrina TaxID=46732 RepID=A0AAU9W5J2_9CNID|nr:unnamed protein product [Pocillopora meandrina]
MWMYMLFLSSKESNNSLENIQLNSIYDALDVFAALNSIFHLTAISIERFFAAVYPRRHRQALQLLYLLFKTYDSTSKISLTLFIVVSLFVIAWLPFFHCGCCT